MTKGRATLEVSHGEFVEKDWQKMNLKSLSHNYTGEFLEGVVVKYLK